MLRGGLMGLRADLRATHGSPLYFPWSPYGADGLRAQQGYLTKFPAELFDVFTELAQVGKAPKTDEGDVPEDHRKSGEAAPPGRTTRAQDPILRAAIERRALDVAAEYYAQQGGTDLIELGKPYDLRVTVAGVDRHAEVKGSSMLIDTVELTINEVNHAKDYAATDLIVVDGIGWTRRADGSVATAGGNLRVWKDWRPRSTALRPRTFAYALPTKPKP